MGIMQNYYMGIAMQILFAAVVVYFLVRLAKRKAGDIPKWIAPVAAVLLLGYVAYIALTGVNQFVATSFGRLALENEHLEVENDKGGHQTLEGDVGRLGYSPPMVVAHDKLENYDGVERKAAGKLIFFENGKSAMEVTVCIIDQDKITRHETDSTIVPISVKGKEVRVLAALAKDELVILEAGKTVIVPDPLWAENTLDLLENLP